MKPSASPGQPLPLYEHCSSLSLAEYLCLLWPDRSPRVVLELCANGALRERNRPVSPRQSIGDLEALALHADLARVPRMFSDVAPSEEAALCRDEALPCIHDDERFVVLDKPAGVPVVPDRDRVAGSCLEILVRRELRARASKPPVAYERPRIVHRIDRWASGLVIVAKTPEAERRLAADFEARQVRKEYRALVSGVVEPARAVVNCPLARGRKGKMRTAGGRAGSSWAALTTYDVLERFDGVSLVAAFPESGRQHQIRVHAWAMGHPLVIDPLYAVGPDAYRGPPLREIERLTLHAHRLTLPPTWDAPRAFHAPLSEDFRAALTALRARVSSDPGRQST